MVLGPHVRGDIWSLDHMSREMSGPWTTCLGGHLVWEDMQMVFLQMTAKQIAEMQQ